CHHPARRRCKVRVTPASAGLSAPVTTAGMPSVISVGVSVALTAVATSSVDFARDIDSPTGPVYVARTSTLPAGDSDVTARPFASVTAVVDVDHFVVPVGRVWTTSDRLASAAPVSGRVNLSCTETGSPKTADAGVTITSFV